VAGGCDENGVIRCRALLFDGRQFVINATQRGRVCITQRYPGTSPRIWQHWKIINQYNYRCWGLRLPAGEVGISETSLFAIAQLISTGSAAGVENMGDASRDNRAGHFDPFE